MITPWIVLRVDEADPHEAVISFEASLPEIPKLVQAIAELRNWSRENFSFNGQDVTHLRRREGSPWWPILAEELRQVIGRYSSAHKLEVSFSANLQDTLMILPHRPAKVTTNESNS